MINIKNKTDHTIDNELQKINNSILDIFKSISEIENIAKNDNSNTQTKKGV